MLYTIIEESLKDFWPEEGGIKVDEVEEYLYDIVPHIVRSFFDRALASSNTVHDQFETNLTPPAGKQLNLAISEAKEAGVPDDDETWSGSREPVRSSVIEWVEWPTHLANTPPPQSRSSVTTRSPDEPHSVASGLPEADVLEQDGNETETEFVSPPTLVTQSSSQLSNRPPFTGRHKDNVSSSSTEDELMDSQRGVILELTGRGYVVGRPTHAVVVTDSSWTSGDEDRVFYFANAYGITYAQATALWQLIRQGYILYPADSSHPKVCRESHNDVSSHVAPLVEGGLDHIFKRGTLLHFEASRRKEDYI